MNTPTQNFKKLVQEHGIKNVSEAIELLIEQKNPAYVSGKVIPTISQIFGYSKNDILKSSKVEYRNVRKLLLYIAREYLNITTKDLANYFKVSKRTVRRHISFVKDVVIKDSKVGNHFYKDFKIKSLEVINKLETEKYGR